MYLFFKTVSAFFSFFLKFSDLCSYCPGLAFMAVFLYQPLAGIHLCPCLRRGSYFSNLGYLQSFLNAVKPGGNVQLLNPDLLPRFIKSNKLESFCVFCFYWSTSKQVEREQKSRCVWYYRNKPMCRDGKSLSSFPC